MFYFKSISDVRTLNLYEKKHFCSHISFKMLCYSSTMLKIIIKKIYGLLQAAVCLYDPLALLWLQVDTTVKTI